MSHHLIWRRDDFLIDTDPDRLDIPLIHDVLTHSSWSPGIDINTVRTAIANSLCFGLYRGARQIGFARVVTDHATFGYLCDVFVLEDLRGQGLGRWLIESCNQHPTLLKLRRVMLTTSTAPWLYARCGFEAINRGDFVWHISRPDIYRTGSAD
ncbi:GNAT family N-acetyltransferase [Herbaspirillum seropedicae]|uniref:Acetyltransferase domain protein n=1 Tax=Herbaspirillum seropedicae (strain SmR1) TaxID=757424 RepID=D8IZR5_HERSS|nr:GNAT family N-acetyltransferase [Herbaspirillum seropedicae]ADJ64405.1 acetyltransferase domain protein [Herbaspirillum seropedicae SmR1]AKN66336.1 histone acetyltransferase [Herbaspirillum seropedicae]AON55152.1 acetyltransferase domain-containing protein [Herbaspirillum seropedicae]MDR6393779.1 GNAT superfamily N-acetyltransferase [Herbaspirillum seropedicae]NQE30558.1 histone acetyltransferase [Herbaspirillum seropedicae]